MIHNYHPLSKVSNVYIYYLILQANISGYSPTCGSPPHNHTESDIEIERPGSPSDINGNTSDHTSGHNSGGISSDNSFIYTV